MIQGCIAQFDINMEISRLINESPITILVWRAEQGWPVELVSENVRQFGYSPEDLLCTFIGVFNIFFSHHNCPLYLLHYF